MKVGSLVECINDSGWTRTTMSFEVVDKVAQGPIKGDIYVVSGVNVPINKFITLEEYPGLEAFYIEAFREVQPPGEVNIEDIKAVTDDIQVL